MIQGSLVAIVTPMHADGGVDEQAFRRLIDWHVAQGTDAIVAVGTTGESATLDEDEHCAAIAVAVDQAGGRIPVIAGTGANSTSEAIAPDAMRQGCRCGCLPAGHAVLQQADPGRPFPASQGGRRGGRHPADPVQRARAHRGRHAPETVARIAQIDNVVGVKEATGQLDRITRLRELTPPGFAVYSGDDATAREAILLAPMVTSRSRRTSHRRRCTRCAAAALAGDSARAEQLDAPWRACTGTCFSRPIRSRSNGRWPRWA